MSEVLSFATSDRTNTGVAMRSLTKALHFSESIILLAAVYFFWYPSSFPAKTGDSGIVQGEWLWLVGVAILLAVFWLIQSGDIQIPLLREAPVLIALPLAYLYLMWQAFSGGGIVTQVDRADYIPLLALLIPVLLLRLLIYRRLWTRTPLDVFMVAFVVLCLFSINNAPYPSRGWQMLARPLLGMALVIYLVELGRTTGKMAGGLWIMVALSLLVGVMALGSTQWTEKSTDFQGLINLLGRRPFFFATSGFNPNEIAGAIAWLVPLMGGLLFYRPGSLSNNSETSGQTTLMLWRALTGGAFLLMLLALMLGQSRSAIIGVLAALVGVALLAVPVGRWRLRYWALAGIVLLILFQVAVTFNILPDTNETSATTGGSTGDSVGLTRRDERTIGHRFAIWGSALDIVLDHPLTGVGINRFRYGPVRDDYTIEEFPTVYIPHAHNEFVQVAADLGLPGLLVFAGWTIAAGFMLWVCWRDGDDQVQVVTVALAGGLLAHLAYGMTDAIPLWDRFSFISWLMLGLVAAQYSLVRDKA